MPGIETNKNLKIAIINFSFLYPIWRDPSGIGFYKESIEYLKLKDAQGLKCFSAKKTFTFLLGYTAYVLTK